MINERNCIYTKLGFMVNTTDQIEEIKTCDDSINDLVCIFKNWKAATEKITKKVYRLLELCDKKFANIDVVDEEKDDDVDEEEDDDEEEDEDEDDDDDEEEDEGLKVQRVNFNIKYCSEQEAVFRRLKYSIKIYKSLINEYSYKSDILKCENLPRVKHGHAQLCLFIWMFILRKKVWKGTATELLQELVNYARLGNYRLKIGSPSVLSKDLKMCKDFLEKIGIGYEKAYSCHKLWLITSSKV